MIKLSPHVVSDEVRVYVESLQYRGDDQLQSPKIQGDVAVYDYCAAREADHAIAPCRRKSLEKDAYQNLLLRVTMVSKIPTRVSFSVLFETVGPSCKFPVSADHSGEYEYKLSITNKMHVCYQLEPVPDKKKSKATAFMSNIIAKVKGISSKGVGAEETTKVVDAPASKFYHVHIELEDESEPEVLNLLRVYGKSKTGTDWVGMEPYKVTDKEAVFKLEYTSVAAPPGEGFFSGFSTAGADGLENVMATRLKTIANLLSSPSWITVTVLDTEPRNFKIWFVDTDDEHRAIKADEDDDSQVLPIIVGSIIMCFACLILALVCCFKGAPSDVKYQRLDKPLETTELDDDDTDAVDIEMDQVKDHGQEDMVSEGEEGDDVEPEGFDEQPQEGTASS